MKLLTLDRDSTGYGRVRARAWQKVVQLDALASRCGGLWAPVLIQKKASLRSLTKQQLLI